MDIASVLYNTLFVVYLALVFSAVLVIILDNRQPVKTIAWILVLLFLPVVGLVMYAFFGRNRKRDFLISRVCAIQLGRRAASRFYRSYYPETPPEHHRLIRLFRRQSAAFPYPDNRVDVYYRGVDWLQDLLEDIARATHHIHMEFYIYEDDEVGRLVYDALVQKVREGVRVRLVYDDVGCWRVPAGFYEKMKADGIEVYGFLPVRFPKFTSKVNFRNHRKIVVIDGQIGYVGGMNIARRYFYDEAGKPASWRDTQMRLKGSAVQGLQRAFLADWYVASEQLIVSPEYYPSDETLSRAYEPSHEPIGKKALVQIVTSMPAGEWPDIMQGMVLSLLKAQRYCYIQSPYFLPTDRLLFAMQTAALSGVDVRLMIPAKADQRVLTWASRSYLSDVMRAGVRVYLYRKGFLHAKTWVSDDSLASCGSTNMDFRSFEHNFEVNAFVYDKCVALAMKEQFLADQGECCLLNLERWMKRSVWQRIGESFIRLMSPLL